MRRPFVAAVFLFAPALSAADGRLQFNRDIRPILSEKCFLCHGPDAKTKNIPIRLDVETEAKADHNGRRAIVPGDPDKSELIRRISAEKKPLLMPPVYSGLKLTAHEVETLRVWIAQGAEWQKHWAFIAPVRPELPRVRNSSWPRNAIDHFILARLEREILSPSPETSRETLLRRASLDVTGLPPTPAEIDAFLGDASPEAWTKVVDRLLASPRYGERMAARWLDYARYADTNGYQFDGERYMWRWRDWVISAFNRNLPYDRFVLEQIAGDMLPGATLDQVIATGFNRNHRGNTEDGIVPEEYAVEYVVDRVETTCTVFLGLTMGCARCHNHKYDPFSQREFYQLFAYFNNIPENGRAMKYGNSPPLVAAPTAEQQQAHARLQAQIRAVEEFLADREPQIARAQQQWEHHLPAAGTLYWAPPAGIASIFELELPGLAATPAGPPEYKAGRVGNAAWFDGTTFLQYGEYGNFDIEDHWTIAAWVYGDGKLDGPVASRMADNPKGRGYGLHLNNGRVHVHLTSVYETDALRVETEESIAPGQWHHLAATYDGSRMVDGVSVYIDGRPAKLKFHANTLYRPFRNAGRRFAEPFRIAGGWGTERRFKGGTDDVRLYARVLSREEIESLAVGQPVGYLAGQPPSRRTAAEARLLRWHFLENAAPNEIRQAWDRLVSLRREREILERSFPTVMVMAEQPVRRDTFFLVRGAYDKPGEKVEAGVPLALPPLPPAAPNNRLGFARWLVDPSNPLTARVAVNRTWQMYLGVGLVKTTEDFGVQGEWPSHPELLDWLATEFVRSGWDMKALQKLILTSATYRQSSRVSAELLQKDPGNRLLARGPRFRLPAEMIRDQALLAAGLLAEKLGGPSVKPYQPPDLWKELIMQDMEYVQSKGPDLYRRSLYTFWKRTVPPPVMVNFDSANREVCVVRESRTNTPLQALNMMNDVTFLEAARFIGQRMMNEGGSTPELRLRHGFRLLTGRAPVSGELEILQDSLRYHLDYFAGKPEAVDAYLNQGVSPPDPALGRRELASYAAVASLILNLDEAVTKE